MLRLRLGCASLSKGLSVASRTRKNQWSSGWLYRTLPASCGQLNNYSTRSLQNGSSGVAKRSTTEKGSEVRYWVQDFPWSKTKKKADPQYPFLDEKSGANIRRLKEEHDRSKGELRDLRRELIDESYLEPLIQKLPTEAQNEIRLQAQRSAEEELQQAKRANALFSEIEIRSAIPLENRIYLERLNSNFREVLNNESNQKHRMKLWQSYARCKAFLPPFLHLISNETWDFLVRVSMSAQLMNDPHWASHRITLYEDMRATDRAIDSSQTLLYIEALNFQGHGERAVVQWQDMQGLVKDNRTSLAHYELIGVDLFTSQSNPRKAEEIAFEYLAREPPEESRILVPILATWLERGDTTGWKHAWALYLRMKAQLGSAITMTDYDSVMMAFLNGGKTNLALAVFKDMMLTGHKSQEDSLELYKKAVGFLEEDHPAHITAEDINTVALTSLAYLPKYYQNRFFYGKWLKKLISMGETDAAAMVIELLYERGIKPDSKHMNGIIGAWLRSTAPADNQKAESMAWSMIHERLDFVKKRGRSDIRKADTPLPLWVPFPTHINRGPAHANIETFSLLLLHYVNLRSNTKVEIIKGVLGDAMVRPNAFFMNHLLLHDLLQGNLAKVWTKYLEDFADICPSLETFELLWDSEKKHLERIIIKQPDEYPGPRLIMREMMNWFLAPARTVKEQNQAREDFSKKFYDLIIRCMCLAKDFEGVIVALYALRDAFGVYPDANTAKMITLHIALMGLGVGEGDQAEWMPRRQRIKRSPQVKANVDKVDNLFKMIWQQRNQFLLTENGAQDLDADEKFQQEEGLFVLAEFLRNVLQRITPGLAEDGALSVEANLKTAAASMGVSGINLKDPHTFHGQSAGPSNPKSVASSG